MNKLMRMLSTNDRGIAVLVTLASLIVMAFSVSWNTAQELDRSPPYRQHFWSLSRNGRVDPKINPLNIENGYFETVGTLLEECVKLAASDANSNYLFGRATAVSGDTIIVGARGASGGGAAYIFQRDSSGRCNWDQVTKLIISDPQWNHQLGWSVSISGDTAIVGAPGEFITGLPSAYIYQRKRVGQWRQAAQLIASDAVYHDRFGDSVAISGDIAIIGARRDDDAGQSSGSAYIFHRNVGGRNNWGEVAKLTASDASEGDEFGYSVAVSGKFAIVGARWNDDAGERVGAAYIFQGDSSGRALWRQVAKLNPRDLTLYDTFGFSVSISGDVAIVGAPYHDTVGTNTGAVYIFQRDVGRQSNWVQVAKLTASGAVNYDYFGSSVAINEELAIVGAPGDFDTGIGSAYIFHTHHGNWREVTKLIASDAAEGDNYGHYSVDIDGEFAIVGAPNDNDVGESSGAVYVYELMD